MVPLHDSGQHQEAINGCHVVVQPHQHSKAAYAHQYDCFRCICRKAGNLFDKWDFLIAKIPYK
jgi:hypothetical protein